LRQQHQRGGGTIIAARRGWIARASKDAKADNPQTATIMAGSVGWG